MSSLRYPKEAGNHKFPLHLKYELWEKAADMNGDGSQNAIDFAIMGMKLLGQK